ncbi:MAG: hypothetical protein M5R36_23995 [Deltaproteobacteria bacterium]|nr:hypothetical protein [Deltaproteobacteria bacterium]
MSRRALFIAVLVLGCAAAAQAGDFEHSPRFLGLADTGNAAFNPTNMPPVFENIATAADPSKFYIGGESRSVNYFGFGSEDDVDYNMLLVRGGASIKSFYPFGEDDDDDWTGRFGLLVAPGVAADVLRVRINDDDTELELTDLRVVTSPAIRMGLAYGFHEAFAAGLGFTMYPSAAHANQFEGTQNTPDGSDNADFQDNWVISGPFAFTPEVGFLWRTNTGMQFGLAYEMGYFAKRETSVEHQTKDGDFDYDTEVAVVKPHNLGLGWAYKIDDIDDFYVSADLDLYFRQTYEGDTYDVRRGRDYYVRSAVPVKDDPTTWSNEPLDPNRHKIGEKFYASTNNRYILSAAVEKAFETVSLRGGMGYQVENGLDRDRPLSSFFTTVGPTLLFDEAIYMAAAGRFDIGFAGGETTYLVLGTGGSLMLGGTF